MTKKEEVFDAISHHADQLKDLIDEDLEEYVDNKQMYELINTQANFLVYNLNEVLND